jgi:hypothetical protein
MDFGGSSGVTTHRIVPPAGKKGRLLDVGVAVSEATVFASTLGHVQVGISTNLDEYAKLNIATSVADFAAFNTADDTDAIILADIPADGPAVVVTLTEGTGGGLAGKGFPTVIIGWY